MGGGANLFHGFKPIGDVLERSRIEQPSQWTDTQGGGDVRETQGFLLFHCEEASTTNSQESPGFQLAA